MDNASALRKLESPTSGEAGLERARALLRRGRIVAAIRYIQQAMPRHPAAAAELMERSHARSKAALCSRPDELPPWGPFPAR